MINRTALLKDLQRLLPKIEKDILAYSEENPELTEHLNSEYTKAVRASRTAEHFIDWRAAQITQAAVAWLLTCVFVRFLEDNQLLSEPVLAGATERADGTKPLEHAKQRMVAYFNENPTHAERGYLLSLFEELEKNPVVAELLDHKHNPLWQIPISADGAKMLIDFFQKFEPTTAEIIHDFADEQWDTRFLGDLYQDLSESVRKRYALLQTPEFVESFILDYTLEKAKETFGLEGLRLIDPTCGSGHFLLTTFERVFNDWLKREPTINTRVLAQRALDVVHGVDINPYAIAICRFRLFVAAMKAAGSTKINNAPDFHFNLACGDSLLHGRRFEWHGQGLQSDLIDEDPIKHVLEVEDKAKLLKILGQQYHVVVGNPPYIVVPDAALNETYKKRYLTCFKQYSLGVPFTERFFDLAISPKGPLPGAYVGMITTNSFMTRDFGIKLIKNYLPKKDMTHVIDSSAATIPGHNTETVIIFARNQEPVSQTIKMVLKIKEDSVSDQLAHEGEAWNSIVRNLSLTGFEDEFISIEEVDRKILSEHPWSLQGGEAANLLNDLISKKSENLMDCASVIGVFGMTNADDVFLSDVQSPLLKNIENRYIKEIVVGDSIRNWSVRNKAYALFPYDESLNLITRDNRHSIFRYIWPYRTNLGNRATFSKGTYFSDEKPWWSWHQTSMARLKTPLTITFAFMSSHNHFSLDRGGKVFKQTSPIIKLSSNAGEADYLVVLGLLNSSFTSFWSRQVFSKKKGGAVDGKWMVRLEWDSTKLKHFPIPQPLDLVAADETRVLAGHQAIEQVSQKIDFWAQRLNKIIPANVLVEGVEKSFIELLLNNAAEAKVIRARMVALQEELDWLCYQAYGLLDEALIYSDELPLVNAGERAFEIQMARDLEESGGSDAWFTRHDYVKTQNIPAHWPEGYKALVEKRLEVIENNRFIKQIEQPEFKRRWLPLEWEAQEQQALKNWLCSFLETRSFNAAHPTVQTCAQLSDSIHRHEIAKVIAQQYTKNELFDVQTLVVNLIANDQVPQAAADRLKPDAMMKFRAWQDTWEKQRLEDAIDAEFGVHQPLSDEDVEDAEKLAVYEANKQKAALKKMQLVGDIPVPPKYDKGDFRSDNFWSLRGKLDVPKERFFSLPGCEKAGDSTLVIGWAGMNHLQRAQAISAWYLDRKDTDGWEVEKLKPMLVALDELIPWLKQWHNEVDPEYSERMGDFYEGFLNEELRLLGIPKEDLLTWLPVAAHKKASVKKTKKSDVTE